MASIASFATHDLESDVRSYVFSSCRSARMLILSASVARGSGSHFTAWHSCLSQQLHTPCLGQSHSTDLLDKEETKLQVWPPVSLILDWTLLNFERFGISMYCFADLSLNFGIFRTTNALQIKGTLGMIFRPLPCLFRGCTAPWGHLYSASTTLQQVEDREARPNGTVWSQKYEILIFEHL